MSRSKNNNRRYVGEKEYYAGIAAFKYDAKDMTDIGTIVDSYEPSPKEIRDQIKADREAEMDRWAAMYERDMQEEYRLADQDFYDADFKVGTHAEDPEEMRVLSNEVLAELGYSAPY